jgi:crotonobetainyl-CoA:carnitine CoA-transferase CaiB-like acyl-CoA transferase
VLFMPEPHWWPRFCAAVGRPDWVEDPRFATFADRAAHMAELTDLMDQLFATRPLAEWARVFDEPGGRQRAEPAGREEPSFIWGPAATIGELASDPQADAIGLYPVVEHPVAGPFRTVGAPVRVDGVGIDPRGPAPELGQHTVEVLTELGVSPDDIGALIAEGVLGAPESSPPATVPGGA